MLDECGLIKVWWQIKKYACTNMMWVYQIDKLKAGLSWCAGVHTEKAFEWQPSLSLSLSLCKLRILPSIVIIKVKVWEHFFICSIHILVHFRCIAVVRKCFWFRHYIKERLYYESGCQKHACLVLNFQQAL